MHCVPLLLMVSGHQQNLCTLPLGQGEQHGEKLRLKGLAGCYALFQYLTMGIQAANGVYNQARKTMEELRRTLTHHKQSNSDGEASAVSFTADQSAVDSRQDVTRLACECEAIAVQQAALHRYHNSIDVFPLATLRQTLTSAITAWPGCAPLWSIYVQVSQGPFF